MPSSAKYVEIVCATCGDKVLKRDDFVRKVLKEKRKLVCSRQCAVPHRKPSVYKSVSLDEYNGKNRTSVCKLCKQELPIKQFIKKSDNKHQKFRKSWFCETCRPLRIKEYMLKNKYGMDSIKEFEALLLKQRGLCAICSKDMQRPCVDHDHKTGKVRAMLCVQCNTLIGRAFDNTDILQKAIVYLKKHA